MAPPECTACLGTASVLPPTPTVLSSCVHVNCEPARRGVGGEKGDEVEEKDKGKGRDGDDSDEVGDEGEGGEYEDEEKDMDEGKEMDEDEEMDGEEDVPVVRFGLLKGRPGSGHVKSVTHHGDLDADASFASTFDSNKYIFVTIIILDRKSVV